MLVKLYSLLSKKDKRLSYFLLIAMVIGAFLEALGIGLIIPILSAINQDDAYSDLLKPLKYFVVDQSSPEFILLLFILLTIFFIFKNIFIGIMYWFQYRFIYRTRANLSKKIFNWYLHENIFFHKSRNSSKLLNSLVNDTNIFSSHGVMPVLIIFTESLVLIAIATFLLFVQPLVMITTICAMGFVLFTFSYLFRNRIKLWGERRIVSESARVKSIHQGLGSIKEIVLRGAQNFFLKDYDIHNNSVAEILSKQATMQSLPRLIFETFTIFFFCIYIIVAAKNDIPLSEILSVLSIFAFSAVRLMPSISRLTGAFQNLRFAKPVIDNFYEDIEFIHTDHKIRKFSQNNLFFKNKISLNNISFKYPNSDKIIIENFNENIFHGECVGIVGKSGSGKSTLADIILGLVKPISGEVIIDDQPINNILQDWQNKIGYVPQDVYLLDDTLESNIAFGEDKSDIDRESINRAIKLAQLDEFISELPDGVTTVVGEHGSRLSGGQKQRIGIARALYTNPDLLIFDEATSALDTKTEKDLVAAIDLLKGKITMIVIAHRISALQSCSRVIDLSK